jgi:outer membrane protein assembly factor BamB
LVVDDDVVVLDPANCRGEPFAPSGWPEPGQLHIGDECRDCAAAPPGCRRWRMFAEDVASAAPLVLADGTVIVHAGAYTRALRDGAAVWRTVTGGGGALLGAGDGVIGVSTGLAEEDPRALFELDIADGRHRWRTPLAFTTDGSMGSSDDVVLAHGGGWIVAGYRETIAAVRRPAAE